MNSLIHLKKAIEDVAKIEQLLAKFDPAGGLQIDIWSGGDASKRTIESPAVQTAIGVPGSDLLKLLLKEKQSDVKFWLRIIEKDTEDMLEAIKGAKKLQYIQFKV